MRQSTGRVLVCRVRNMVVVRCKRMCLPLPALKGFRDTKYDMNDEIMNVLKNVKS